MVLPGCRPRLLGRQCRRASPRHGRPTAGPHQLSVQPKQQSSSSSGGATLPQLRPAPAELTHGWPESPRPPGRSSSASLGLCLPVRRRSAPSSDMRNRARRSAARETAHVGAPAWARGSAAWLPSEGACLRVSVPGSRS